MELTATWIANAAFWLNAEFLWTRWTRAHEQWTHDHCQFCQACICDHRDRDPHDRPGPVEGGHYRHAFYAEHSDGSYIWVCRSCFKRTAKVAGWKRRRRSG